jgi:hypothetical protein
VQTQGIKEHNVTDEAKTINPQALLYLTTLFEKSDIICLTFIHGTKTYAGGGAVTENVFIPLSKVITPSGLARLAKRNKSEHVFVSMATFKPDSANRTKNNIEKAAHLFLDADENGDAVLDAVRSSVGEGDIPAPTVVVQSSPGRYQIIWNVEGLDVPRAEAMNRTLAKKFGTDEQVVDAARVLRIAGFKNIKAKYADPKPIATTIERNRAFLPVTIHDFAIPLAVEPNTTVYPVASTGEIQQSIARLDAAMDEASIVRSRAKEWGGSGGGFKFELELCPWSEAHTDGRPSDAIAIVQPSGAYAFKCLHAHCANRAWDDFRKHLEAKAGKRLSFAPAKPNKKEGRAYVKQTRRQREEVRRRYNV